MTAQSIISPLVSGILCFRTFAAPAESTNSMRTSVAELTVTDFSLPKKSLLLMWATRVTEPGPSGPDLGQGFIFVGCFRANAFTDQGARRSELPSRNTGFTAEPRTPAYRTCTARCSSVEGASG